MQIIWLLNTYFNELGMYHSSEILMKLLKFSYLWVHSEGSCSDGLGFTLKMHVLKKKYKRLDGTILITKGRTKRSNKFILEGKIMNA